MRAARPRRDECPAIDGLSAATVREIRHRSLPVAAALKQWKQFVHGPQRALRAEAFDASCPCCDPFEPRRILGEALTSLPVSARRELREVVAALDETFERRTLPDPAPAPELPWWRRRT